MTLRYWKIKKWISCIQDRNKWKSYVEKVKIFKDWSCGAWRKQECVFVALVTQHAMRMRHKVTCGLPDYTIFFPTLSHTWHDFRKKCYRTYSAWFRRSVQTLPEKILVLSRIDRNILNWVFPSRCVNILLVCRTFLLYRRYTTMWCTCLYYCTIY